MDSSFTYRPKEHKKRPKYGQWYIKPKMWREHMKKDDNGETNDNKSTFFQRLISS